jgi:PAS domain S-box-containing protein
VVRGIPGALVSIACFAGGIAAWAALFDLGFAPQTSNVVTALCFFGSAAYCTAVGYVVYGLRRRLVAGRDALRASDARFRLIAEYAADLIAMVDDEGRWLYASPRYRALLPEHELEPGKDAFARMHPDDAQLARNAVQLAAASRKPREVELRFADRAGRIHRLKSRIEAIEERRGAPKRLVMVSRDMTDVLESEERVLLAAHALEGMTEAIVITAADGTVLTVNRAFTEITGYSREEVVGQNERVVRTALQPAEYFEEMLARARAEGSWSGSTWSRRKNGALYREWRSVRAVRDPGGEITHFVTVFYEASGREGGGAIPAVQT